MEADDLAAAALVTPAVEATRSTVSDSASSMKRVRIAGHLQVCIQKVDDLCTEMDAEAADLVRESAAAFSAESGLAASLNQARTELETGKTQALARCATAKESFQKLTEELPTVGANSDMTQLGKQAEELIKQMDKDTVGFWSAVR